MQDSTLFFSPQMFFIWSRQVTESFKMALEKDHSKKMRLKKKEAVSSLHCWDSITQKGQVIKKKLCIFKGLEGTAEVVYHWNTDQIRIDLFSFVSQHQWSIWSSLRFHKQNTAVTEFKYILRTRIALGRKTHYSAGCPCFLWALIFKFIWRKAVRGYLPAPRSERETVTSDKPQ